MRCTSENNTGTTQRVFNSFEGFNSPQTPSRSVPASDATGQPLSLAEQIERRGCALTAEELSKTLNVSKITLFKQAKAGTHSFTCVRFDPRAVAQWLRSM